MLLNGWSIANAQTGAGELVNAQGNRQRDALLNFLSLYALTRNTSTNGVSDAGSWSMLPVKNGEAVRAALFGSGAADAKQLIQNVWIGGNGTVVVNDVTKNQNPYNGINAVLGQLGFSGQFNDPVLHHAPLNPHYNHFHIDLRTPERVDLPQNLTAGDAATAQVADNALIANAQTWLDRVKADLNLTQGEITMWVPDMPSVPPQEAPVIIAQANQAQIGGAATVRALGVCAPSPNHNYSLENVSDPILAAGYYLQQFEKRNPPGSATTTILLSPQHGVLRLVTQADVGPILEPGGDPVDPAASLYLYLPDSNYVGNDTATIEVDYGNGLKVNVKYYFQAVNRGGLGDDWMGTYCSKTGVYWKVSSTLDANGISTITSVEYQSPATSTATSGADTVALANTLGSSVLSNLAGDTAGVNLNITDLTGGALGQTVGSTITLDTNAAGNGWFIDTTPADNSEFLPTSNPNEWVAKAGSAAYGKMDMLSVLLHEYGHALGIDHSANPGDYMAPTLTAGVRRLPSAEEMALMQQLVAQAKATLSPTLSQWERGQDQNAPGFPTLPLSSSFIGFLGLLRSSRYGGVSIAPDTTTLVTNYEVAANPGFMGLDNSTGWNTQGSVGIAPSTFAPSTGSVRTASATLNEVSGSQTRLNQVFMLSPTDRFLTFTLSGAALGYVKGAPEDAFQVALLDANSGASLLGSDGQTLSDAFLSLQADGAQYAANCVTCINNAGLPRPS